MTSENVHCLPHDSRHLEQCLAHSGYSTVVVKWTKWRMKMKRKRAQENSEEKYTCIMSWTSASKAFICSKEEDGTDQKRRCGQSPALPSCTPCWGTECVLGHLFHTLTPLCGHLCPATWWDMWLPRVGLLVPRPIYAESVCNSTSLNIM